MLQNSTSGNYGGNQRLDFMQEQLIKNKQMPPSSHNSSSIQHVTSGQQPLQPGGTYEGRNLANGVIRHHPTTVSATSSYNLLGKPSAAMGNPT